MGTPQPTSTTTSSGRSSSTFTADASEITAYCETTSSGETTWFGLARDVYALAGADPALVTPTTTAAYPRPARRPAYSSLGHSGWLAAGINPIGDWREALERALPAMLAAV